MELFNRYAEEKNGESVITIDGFNRMISDGIINQKRIRDEEIKSKYLELRKQKIPAGIAMDKIREAYPYLQYDSIRKLVYAK